MQRLTMKSMIASKDGQKDGILCLDWTEGGGARITLGVDGNQFTLVTSLSRDGAEVHWRKIVRNMQEDGFSMKGIAC